MAFDPAPLWTHLREHGGVVGWREAAALGATHRDLGRLVASGALEVVALGTYRATAHPRSFTQRCQLAVVASRQRSTDSPVAVTRSTAAWLWGIDRAEREPTTIHVVVAHTRTPAPGLPWVQVHRSRTLEHDDVRIHDGIPVTSPARTIVDSAINRSVPDLADIVARSLQQDLLHLDELSDGLERAGRIRGSSRLREAIARVGPDAAAVESIAEEAARAAFRQAGLDAVPQWPVEVGGNRYRLDFAFPERRLAVEVDGHWWHSTPSQKARDDRRRNALAAEGWRVLHFGAGTVMQRPDAVVADVRAALRTPWSA